MFPLKDDVPSHRFPAWTIGLIVFNSLVFLWELSQGRRLGDIFLTLGVVPARYTIPEISSLFGPIEQVIPLFTSMFLHGGWTHVLGNMWTLWIFGDNVEDRLGRPRFLLLYFLGGLSASILHIYTNSGSTVPTIGASGAVAAVMGAYFRLYPRANVVMVVPPFFLGPFFVVPAVLFLGFWFILQFFSGTLSLVSQAGAIGGVAWWAHVGGFVFGALLCSIIREKRFYRRETWEENLPW